MGVSGTKYFLALIVWVSVDVIGKESGPSLHHSSERSLFQVVSSRNAHLVSGKQVNDLQRLQINDEIVLTDGYILLGHSSGQLLEFTGDTLVSIEALTEGFADQMLFPYDEWYGVYVDYSILYQSDSPYEVILSAGATPHVYPNPFEVIYPQVSKHITLNTQEDCLIMGWRTNNEYQPDITPRFRVELKDIFHEQIFYLSLTENYWVHFDSLSIRDSIPDLIVAQVTEIETNYREEILINNQADSPSVCSDIQGVTALEEAVKLEILGLMDLAHEFYRVAAETSNNHLFTDFLGNFQERNGLE